MATKLSPVEKKMATISALQAKIKELEGQLHRELGLDVEPFPLPVPPPPTAARRRKTAVDPMPDAVLAVDTPLTVADAVATVLLDQGGKPLPVKAIVEALATAKLKVWPTAAKAETAIRNVIASSKGRFAMQRDPKTNKPLGYIVQQGK